MSKFDCVCFDLDGTICDSKPGILNGLRFMFEYFGEPAQRDEYFLQFIGLSLDKSLAKYTDFPGHKIKEGIKVFREFYGERGIYDGVLYDGIVEVIEKLHEAKVDLYVVTAKPQMFAEKIIAHFDLNSYFKGIYGLNPDIDYNGKTDDLNAIKKLGYTNMVMVGDRHLDVEAATAAGIESLGVRYGYGSLEELKTAQATYIVENPIDLQNILL